MMGELVAVNCFSPCALVTSVTIMVVLQDLRLIVARKDLRFGEPWEGKSSDEADELDCRGSSVGLF